MVAQLFFALAASFADAEASPDSPCDSAECDTDHEEDSWRLTSLLQKAAPARFDPLAQMQLPTEVDVVVSGGGLKGYFMLGARQAIAARGDLEVRRFAGTSAGAFSAMFMAIDLSDSNWLRTYAISAKAIEAALKRREAPPALMEIYRNEVWPRMREELPADAYERCSGRLFVSLTTLESTDGPRWARWARLPVLRKTVVSNFTSNEELFEACAASSCVPGITQRGFGWRFRGKRSFDGLFTDNVPVFRDGLRPQIVFDIARVKYDWELMVSPSDQCIEALAVSGAIQTARFLDGRRKVDAKASVPSWRGWKGGVYPNHQRPRGLRPLAMPRVSQWNKPPAVLGRPLRAAQAWARERDERRRRERSLVPRVPSLAMLGLK